MKERPDHACFRIRVNASHVTTSHGKVIDSPQSVVIIVTAKDPIDALARATMIYPNAEMGPPIQKCDYGHHWYG